MTPTQVSFWQNEEAKRTNRAKEAETARHNVEQEKIAQVKNDLDSRNLDLKDKEIVLKLAEDVSKYGISSMSEVPNEVLEKYPELFEYKDDHAIWSAIDDMFRKMGQAWETFWSPIGGAKGAATFF